jgi:transcriptional regulator GlxA family with amidase domain
MPTLQKGHHLKGNDVNTRLNHVQDWVALGRQCNWSVRTLAKSCDVSVRTLERHFLKNMGTNPKLWLAAQRQKQAMELLRDGSSVKATASQLGYRYANHFSREFKGYWGYCPQRANVDRRNAD